MRKKELCCDQRHYIHILVYIMSLATSWMMALLTTHKILNKRRIKVHRTRSSVIFIGPGLLVASLCFLKAGSGKILAMGTWTVTSCLS